MPDDTAKHIKGLEAALTAYNAVWQTFSPLDASTVEEARRTAMIAAIAAYKEATA